MSPEEILDALDPDQREVARALHGPVCVLAGAGTGKTRAITHRIAYGVRTGIYKPGGVLAVTFTSRAAGEMRTRLRDLGVAGVQARTFHSAALRQLRFFWPRVVGGAPPRLIEAKAPVVADACHRLGLDVDRLAVRDLASEIEWAKACRVGADDYVRAAAAVDRPAPAGYDRHAIGRLIAAYEDAKVARGVIDMEDILLLLAGVLIEHRAIATEVRDQYRWFVVDEYQDISPLQKLLLEQWLGGRSEVCVVGDPGQTIYSFAGATPSYLLGFTAEHPGAQVVRLVRDYRSTPQVVGLANAVLAEAGRGRAVPEVAAAAAGHADAPAAPRRSRATDAALELVAQRPAGPPVQFQVYDDDDAEAAGVAERIARLLAAGTRASEVAVLYRTNAQSAAFEQALSDAGIGYVLRGGERFFTRTEVREATVRLRGAGLGADPDQPLPELVRDVLSTLGWSAEPPAVRGAVRERWDSLQALVALTDDLDAGLRAEGRRAVLADLVAELDERTAAQHAPTVEGVTLASLHAAKGLEWDAVFLTGLADGLLPWSGSTGTADLEEERRLLYVGVTRAREHLELSWARSRSAGGRATRRRSRFLDRLWPADPAVVRGRGTRRMPAGGAGGGTGTRAVGGAPGAPGAEVDPDLYARLLDWRADVARGIGRPAYTVLAESTLGRIAAARPGSVAELAAIDGVGQAKVGQWGESLLAVVTGTRR